MASYCTPQDLIDRFGVTELAQLAPATPGPVDTAKVQRACSDASNLVDGYLRPRHTLPLSAVPDLLAKLTADMARFDLHNGGDRQPTEQVIRNHDAAIAFLKDVSAGRADLGITSAGDAPIESSGSIRSGRGTPGLSEGDLAAYRGAGALP